MTREEAVYELERMKTWSKDLSDNEIEALVVALKALSNSEKPNKWIHVSERLPKENGQYLITVKYKHVNDSYEDVYAEYGEWSDGRWDMFCFGHCGEVEDIIAWMPLPEPYRMESEDKG